MTADPSPTRGPKTPPGGLSRWGKDVWAELAAVHEFSAHERVTLERALRWWALEDRLLEEAEPLNGRERHAKLKAAGDAATTALRHWRTLKFCDPASPGRGPGRRPGDGWSEMRRPVAPTHPLTRHLLSRPGGAA